MPRPGSTRLGLQRQLDEHGCKRCARDDSTGAPTGLHIVHHSIQACKGAKGILVGGKQGANCCVYVRAMRRREKSPTIKPEVPPMGLQSATIRRSPRAVGT